MRIISGKFKGRRFYPPAKNWPTRPTTDMAKEGLYNILQNRLDFAGMRMLDLFGGTGSHSFECISRGCLDVTYVDRFGECVKFVQNLSRELEVDELMSINRADVFRFCHRARGKFDFIFAGPPYAMQNIGAFHEFLLGCNLLAEDGIFVLETNDKYDYSGHDRFVEVRNYGQCHFHFFS